MKTLEASLLAFDKDLNTLKIQLEKIKNSGIKNIHYDVMDGKFVKNTSFFGEHIELLNEMDFVISVHLMVEDVDKFVNQFIKYKIDYLTFHFEPISKEESIKQITKINNAKIQSGIAIKPNSKISDTIDLINLSKIITIMSVEPGLGGQTFIMETINKLKEVRKLNNNIIIQVDGGLNTETSELIRNETNFFVMGTYLIENIEKSKEILEKINGYKNE